MWASTAWSTRRSPAYYNQPDCFLKAAAQRIMCFKLATFHLPVNRDGTKFCGVNLRSGGSCPKTSGKCRIQTKADPSAPLISEIKKILMFLKTISNSDSYPFHKPSPNFCIFNFCEHSEKLVMPHRFRATRARPGLPHEAVRRCAPGGLRRPFRS